MKQAGTRRFLFALLFLAALLLLPGGIAAADAHHTFVLKCGGGGFVGTGSCCF